MNKRRIHIIILIVLGILFLVEIGIAFSVYIDEKARDSIGILLIPACLILAFLFLIGICVCTFLIKKNNK